MPPVRRLECSLEDLGRKVADGLDHPVVVASPSDSWLRSSLWSPASLAQAAGDIKTSFRVWPLASGSVWENDCPTVAASFADFHEWFQREMGERQKISRSNPLFRFPLNEVCLYAGYKEMKDLFGGGCPVHDCVDWSCVGLPGRGGSKTVFWMGTIGAYTPCHFDTYGYNIVAQLYGQKKWTLFAPADSQKLYPTRIPYEESSVFSSVDHKHPDLQKHPHFAQAEKFEVTLVAGDVLFVPKHWWHLVESESTSISVNTWVELDSDRRDRVAEAVARTMVTAIKTLSSSSTEEWLNPNEVLESHEQNLGLLRIALSSCQPSDAMSGCASSFSSGGCHGNADQSACSQSVKSTHESLVCARPGPQAVPDVDPPPAKRYLQDVSGTTDTTADQCVLDPSPQPGSAGLSYEQRSALETRVLNAVLSPDILDKIVEKLVK